MPVQIEELLTKLYSSVMALINEKLAFINEYLGIELL